MNYKDKVERKRKERKKLLNLERRLYKKLTDGWKDGDGKFKTLHEYVWVIIMLEGDGLWIK